MFIPDFLKINKNKESNLTNPETQRKKLLDLESTPEDLFKEFSKIINAGLSESNSLEVNAIILDNALFKFTLSFKVIQDNIFNPEVQKFIQDIRSLALTEEDYKRFRLREYDGDYSNKQTIAFNKLTPEQKKDYLTQNITSKIEEMFGGLDTQESGCKGAILSIQTRGGDNDHDYRPFKGGCGFFSDPCEDEFLTGKLKTEFMASPSKESILIESKKGFSQIAILKLLPHKPRVDSSNRKLHTSIIMELPTPIAKFLEKLVKEEHGKKEFANIVEKSLIVLNSVGEEFVALNSNSILKWLEDKHHLEATHKEFFIEIQQEETLTSVNFYDALFKFTLSFKVIQDNFSNPKVQEFIKNLKILASPKGNPNDNPNKLTIAFNQLTPKQKKDYLAQYITSRIEEMSGELVDTQKNDRVGIYFQFTGVMSDGPASISGNKGFLKHSMGLTSMNRDLLKFIQDSKDPINERKVSSLRVVVSEQEQLSQIAIFKLQLPEDTMSRTINTDIIMELPTPIAEFLEKLVKEEDGRKEFANIVKDNLTLVTSCNHGFVSINSEAILASLKKLQQKNLLAE